MNVPEKRSFFLAWVALATFVLPLLSTGCSRSFYRLQADEDAYRMVGQHATDPRWPLEGFTIDVDPRSRMYDPYPADEEPIPPDDPTSHRLMHCVDCKEGYPCWHANGDTSQVDNPDWPLFLPLDQDSVLVLDMPRAMQMAYLHSTDYQRELEDLYLSALDVSFERFRFDAQFFGGNDTTYTADGRVRANSDGRSNLTTATDLQMRRLFTTGGELVVGLANSIVWQFAGANTDKTTTLVDFSLVQPLLRAGGRARVMERLTVSERTLLANVRQMERFRRGFFIEITTGGDAGEGPSRRGGFFGGSGLEGFTGIGGGGFGRVGSTGGGSGFTSGAGALEAGGYLGVLQDQQQIRNQETNVVALGESLAQLQSSFLAGRIDRFQVDLARQALYNAQSVLMSSKTGYQSQLDDFVRDLGLPPDLNVRIDGEMLDQFNLISPALQSLQRSLSEIQLSVGEMIQNYRDAQETPPGASSRVEEMRLHVLLAVQDCEKAVEYVAVVEADLEVLEANLPVRKKHLKRLSDQIEAGRHEVDPGLLDGEKLSAIVPKLRAELATLAKRLDATPAQLQQLATKLAQLCSAVETIKPEDWKDAADLLVAEIPEQLKKLSTNVFELTIIQAEARTETIVLEPVDLDPRRALKIAAVNRRDWMNRRAALVDTYRLIEFNANDLESGLDIVFSGDISNVGNNPTRLRNTNGRLRVGLEFDAPLTRLSERNVYRQALIEYQQARRQYYERVDRINQSLRATLRTVELNQLNFELRRAAMRVAIDQVELIRLLLNEPPRPGEEKQFEPTTASNLVSALSSLLSVQNDFLSVWVNYEVLRLGLDFNLGTMQLNEQGLWVDPGSIDETFHPLDDGEPPVELPVEPTVEPVLRVSHDAPVRATVASDGPPPLKVPKRAAKPTAVKSESLPPRGPWRPVRRKQVATTSPLAVP